MRMMFSNIIYNHVVKYIGILFICFNFCITNNDLVSMIITHPIHIVRSKPMDYIPSALVRSILCSDITLSKMLY